VFSDRRRAVLPQVVARGLFGTTEEDHASGEAVQFMAWSDVYTPAGGASWAGGLAAFLGSAVTDADTTADFAGAQELPLVGIARIEEELVLYQIESGTGPQSLIPEPQNLNPESLHPQPLSLNP